MSWGGGTQIAIDMIHSIEEHVFLYITKVTIYKDLIGTLNMSDWGDKSECFGISDAFDEALKETDPGWFEDPDDD